MARWREVTFTEDRDLEVIGVVLLNAGDASREDSVDDTTMLFRSRLLAAF
jgi:hypothetical protein